jgi:hypothetical protein
MADQRITTTSGAETVLPATAIHTEKEYARGEVHENWAECLFSLLKHTA